MAIAIVLAVRLIVLLGIGDDVHQREAIMSGEEVDAAGLGAAVAAEKGGRAGKDSGDIADLVVVAAPETAQIVTGAVIPFEKRSRKIAELVPARADIPGSAIMVRSSRTSSANRDRSVRLSGSKPLLVRPMTVARSKRKPSMPAWSTKWRRLSMMSWRVAGWSRGNGIAGAGVVDQRAQPVRLMAEIGGIVEAAQ